MSGAKASNDKKGGGLGRVMGSYIAPDFTWNEFTWLRQHWDGKIVVKGVQSWQDAKMCADAGLDGGDTAGPSAADEFVDEGNA